MSNANVKIKASKGTSSRRSLPRSRLSTKLARGTVVETEPGHRLARHLTPTNALDHVDYEIIEVNGFQIKRKKPKTSEGSAPAAATAATYATPPFTKLGGNKHTVATPQRTPNVEEYEISAELYNRLTEALHDDLTDVSRLLAVCSSVCAAELDEVNKGGNERVASALETVFGNFMDGIAAALDDESIQMAPAVDEFQGDDFKVDIASRKLGLQRRLEVLKKEEQEWGELLAKVDAIDLSVGGLGGGRGWRRPGRVDDGRSRRTRSAGCSGCTRPCRSKVTTQVEGVSLVIGNIEQLMERAGARGGRTPRRTLHARRYRAYHAGGRGCTQDASSRPSSGNSAQKRRSDQNDTPENKLVTKNRVMVQCDPRPLCRVTWSCRQACRRPCPAFSPCSPASQS